MQMTFPSPPFLSQKKLLQTMLDFVKTISSVTEAFNRMKLKSFLSAQTKFRIYISPVDLFWRFVAWTIFRLDEFDFSYSKTG